MKKRILNFFTVTLGGMANGLFATLIIGTIFATIGTFFTIWPNSGFCNFMVDVIGTNSQKSGLSYVLQLLTGTGIGVGIALALKMDALKTICLAVVGELASYFSMTVNKSGVLVENNTFKVGDPLTIFLVCISVALLMKLVLRKKTSVDILIIPLFSCAVGLLLSLGIRYPAAYVTFAVQWLINVSTNAVPFIMGVVVAVLMGMALTAPISSAAIGAILFSIPATMTVSAAMADSAYSGLLLASGAAIVGCSTQMVGFAIQSRKDNNIGQIISIGIGTSMLQIKNIIRKPVIWLPTIIASAILGPISTCVLKLVCPGASSGMGTAGLVGQIGTFSAMGNSWQTWVGIFLLQIIAPIALVFGIDLLFRKIGWIKDGDFALKREEEQTQN
ncbi:MAG: PTS sugar transporter subunit IIC [Bacilli bacterium]|nr:PTS sugar transporter subunit IIC [Bacilli bacterium]